MSTDQNAYQTAIDSYCPAGAGALLKSWQERGSDEAAEKLSVLFDPQDGELPPILCVRAMTGQLAAHVPASATERYMTFLLGHIWAIWGELSEHPDGAPHLDDAFLADLRQVYARVPYIAGVDESGYAGLYFGCARALGVDLRAALDGVIQPDWNAAQDWHFSETWAWACYLASYGDPRALAELSAFLHRVSDANDVLAMLAHLAHYPVVSIGMRQLIASFSDDRRLTDNGIESVSPIQLGVEVHNLLAMI